MIQPVTAVSLFKMDEAPKVIEEMPDLTEDQLDDELSKRWEQCRREDPEKFKYYVSMLCDILFPASPPLPPPLKASPSRYHDGPCTPDERRCQDCWSYWCGHCGTGHSSWMTGCCKDKEYIINRHE
jgi:hypothetical protein